MKISATKSVEGPENTKRWSYLVDDFEVWFELPVPLAAPALGPAMVCSALLPAMMQGEPLILPKAEGLDETFLSNMEKLQETYLAWQAPLGLKLAPVSIEAEAATNEPTLSDQVFSFFSGGVDGTYTAIKGRDQISGGILLRGIDMQLTNEELWASAKSGAKTLADHLELPLLAVTTNIRFLGYHFGLKWARHYQGAGLAAISHMLAPKTMLVAATSSLADLAPYGSHPMTDPLWSSMHTNIVHSHAIQRTEKLRMLARDPAVLRVLRVCWRDNGYNCGKCGKCLRTMVALELLGVQAESLPSSIDWKAVERIVLGDPSEWAFFEALESLEMERPHPKARRALKKIRKNSLLRSGLRDLDNAFGHHFRAFRKSMDSDL